MPAAVDTAFARAAHVVRLETWVQRVTGVPMEPRAAVGDWDPASGRYTVHAGAGGLGRTQHRGGRRARRAGERGARGGARRGREFRDAQQLLSGVRAGRLGGAAPRPAREVDGRAARGVPRRLPGPRPRRRTPSWRSTPTATSWRSARANTSNVGAHAVSFHPLNKGMAITAHRLPRARRVDARPRRRHQHVADHAVPQRRAARGHVRHGAADRPRRAPARLRSARAAAAEPGARRARCRTGTPSAWSTTAATIGPRWTARWSSPTGPGSRPAAPRRAGAAAIAGSASRTTSSSTPAFPRERAHITVRPEGSDRRGARHALVRPGPRDELRPAAGRVARGGARRGAAGHRRHRRHRRRAAARIPRARCGSPRS